MPSLREFVEQACSNRIQFCIECTPEGNLAVVEPEMHEQAINFAWLQELLDGYVVVLHPPTLPGYVMVVNEDGELKGLPINDTATLIYGGVVLGSAVICKETIIGTEDNFEVAITPLSTEDVIGVFTTLLGDTGEEDVIELVEDVETTLQITSCDNKKLN